VQFQSARYVPPADKREGQVLVVVQSDAKDSTETFSLLPHDALQMVEGVATAMHQAGQQGTDRVVRALAGIGVLAKPNPPPGLLRAALVGEISPPKGRGQDSRKPDIEEESTQIVAVGKIFLTVGTATVSVPPHTPVIYLGFEGAEMTIEYTALDVHDAYLLAESLVTTLAKSGMSEARRLAKQLKERR
jgi:hypothetical protein